MSLTPVLAIVGRIIDIRPHVDPEVTRVEVISVSWRLNSDATHQVIDLVTGKHYCVGDLGVWLRPGASIPGWLAGDLWMVGKKKAADANYRFSVEPKTIKGEWSPGLWIGQFYQTDTSKESSQHYRELKERGGIETIRDGKSWITPAYWNPDWRVGDIIDEELDLRPSSSVEEHPVVNREVAARENVPPGSTPALGSND